MLGVRGDAHIATLKGFLAKVPWDIADDSRGMDEAGGIEQDVHGRRKVKIPKKIFLVGREKLSREKREEEIDKFLDRYSLA